MNWLAAIGNPSVDTSDVYSYGYTMDGRRAGKANYTNKIRYLYDGTNVAYENWSDGTHIRYTHPLAGYGMEGCGSCGKVCGPTSNTFVDHPISMTLDGQKYYYLYDGLGSITEVIDSNEDVVNEYRYSPFGQAMVKNETIYNPYQYTGRRYDEESGLYYYRARMYSPEMSRFTSNDPAGMVDGANMYAYVGNNPTGRRDPSGKQSAMWRDLEALSYIIGFLHQKKKDSIYDRYVFEAKIECNCNSELVQKFYGGCGHLDYLRGPKDLKMPAYNRRCFRKVYWDKVISMDTVSVKGGGGRSTLYFYIQ